MNKMEIVDIVSKIDQSNYLIITEQHDEYQLTSEYLLSIGREDMAEQLTYYINENLVKIGPLKDCLAAVVKIDGIEMIIISSEYPDFNNIFERATSIIHELSLSEMFNHSFLFADALCKNFRKWLQSKYPELVCLRQNSQPINETSLSAKTGSFSAKVNKGEGVNGKNNAVSHFIH